MKSALEGYFCSSNQPLNVFDSLTTFSENIFANFRLSLLGPLHPSNLACPISDFEQYFMQKSGLCSVDLLKWLLGISFYQARSQLPIAPEYLKAWTFAVDETKDKNFDYKMLLCISIR